MRSVSDTHPLRMRISSCSRVSVTWKMDEFILSSAPFLQEIDKKELLNCSYLHVGDHDAVYVGGEAIQLDAHLERRTGLHGQVLVDQ